MTPRSQRGHGPRREPGAEGLRATALRRLDLRSLDVPSGGALVLTATIPIDPLTLAGQPYTAQPAMPEFRLDVVRAIHGWHLRLRGEALLVGPCWRCLEEARVATVIDATEVSQDGATDPELTSLYVHHGELATDDWARDALVEALPATMLCREDCAGLCPTCGANHNAGPCACTPAGDPRWGALAGLAERLRAPDDPDPDTVG